jgi:hypothetical protein
MGKRVEHANAGPQDLVKLRVTQFVEGSYCLHVDVAHDVLLSSSHRPLTVLFMLSAHR